MSKCYVLQDASDDEQVKQTFEKIKNENGKIDGLVHAIANANTEDLHNDFIYTSKQGFEHALDVSCYSFILAARTVKELDMLNENASILTLTYYGSQKVIEGYNIMGVAKAALESATRYLAFNLGKEKVRVNAISAGPIKTLSAKGIKDFSKILGIIDEKVEELWTEVMTYIEDNYDTDYLERIYLQGDGGKWIVSGKEY